MGKLEKLIAKLGNQNSDNAWTYADAVYLLENSDFLIAGGKGSHQVYQNAARQKTVVLARHGNKIKSGYIKSIRKALNENEQ